MLELIGWVVVMGLIGYLLGRLRGVPGWGAVGSILLGPIGWLAILASSDQRLKCPDCKGAVPEGARKCMHCGSTLWTPPAAPGRASGIELKCPKCAEDGWVNSGKDHDQVECPACHHEFKIIEGKWAATKKKDAEAEHKWRSKLAGFRGTISS